MADAGADAVITASAIINIIMTHNRRFSQAEKKNNDEDDKIKKDMLNEITNYVKAMKSAMI
jgi:tryptophan synthase alpha subunit